MLNPAPGWPPRCGACTGPCFDRAAVLVGLYHSSVLLLERPIDSIVALYFSALRCALTWCLLRDWVGMGRNTRRLSFKERKPRSTIRITHAELLCLAVRNIAQKRNHCSQKLMQRVLYPFLTKHSNASSVYHPRCFRTRSTTLI